MSVVGQLPSGQLLRSLKLRKVGPQHAQCLAQLIISTILITLSHSLGGKKIALRGGGGDTEAHFPNPPPSLAAVTGGGVQGGGARPAVPGGGGVSTQHLWLKMIPTSPR